MARGSLSQPWQSWRTLVCWDPARDLHGQRRLGSQVSLAHWGHHTRLQLPLEGLHGWIRTSVPSGGSFGAPPGSPRVRFSCHWGHSGGPARWPNCPCTPQKHLVSLGSCRRGPAEGLRLCSGSPAGAVQWLQSSFLLRQWALHADAPAPPCPAPPLRAKGWHHCTEPSSFHLRCGSYLLYKTNSSDV